MRNILFTLIFSMFLAACGSGSESEIDHEQLALLKGLEQSPQVTFLSSIESGDSIALNQSISGEITSSETASFDYYPLNSGYVSFQYDSPSENVWLRIKEDGVGTYTRLYSRGQPSVFDLSAGTVYTFELYQYFLAEDGFTLIEKPDEIGAFEISLVELNRQSLQLSENEYLLELNYNGNFYEEGRPEISLYNFEESGSENYQRLLIVNFLDGYNRDLYQELEIAYAQVSGSTFEFRTEAEIKRNSEVGLTLIIPESQQTFKLDVRNGSISGWYHREYDIGLEQSALASALVADPCYFETVLVSAGPVDAVVPTASEEPGLTVLPALGGVCAAPEVLNSAEDELLYSDLKTDWLRISDGTIIGKIIL